MKDEEMIKELFRKYVALWNNQDIASWGRLFTDDTDFVTWSGVKYSSNPENVEQHDKAHRVLSAKDQNMTYALKIQKISFIRPDIALVHAAWSWKDFKVDHATIVSRAGILTMLLLKANGRWLIRSTQNTRTDQNQGSNG